MSDSARGRGSNGYHPGRSGRSTDQNGASPFPSAAAGPSAGGAPGGGNPSPATRFRIRFDARSIGRGIRETWRGIVRVMGLVWATSPKLTASLAIATLLQSIMPAGQVWLAGRLIDEVVEGIAAGGAEESIRAIVVDRHHSAGLFCSAPASCRRRATSASNCLQERLAIHVQLQIMRHAATLDMADFENAELLRSTPAGATGIGAAAGGDGLRRLRPGPLAGHLRHDDCPAAGAVALGGGGGADRAHPGVHLRLALRLVGLPADAAAIAGAAGDVVSDDADDDR